MPRPVRIALLGNSFAEKVLLPSLKHVASKPDVELEISGVAGRDEAKAAATAERWGLPYATGDWRRLLERGCDLAILATPVDLHFEMAIAAIEAGSAVLCEKPFTLDVAQAEELCAAARGRLALVDHQLRFNPLRRKLRELLEQGFVGEVLHARCDLVLASAAYMQRGHGWWFEAERGGGTLGALSSHLVDGLSWLLGPVEAVSARLGTFVRERPGGDGEPRPVTSDDFAELWLRFESGALASSTTSVSMPGASRWLLEIAGSQGTLRLDQEDDLVGGPHGEDMRTIEPDAPLPDPRELGMQASGAFAACAPLLLEAVVRAVAAGESEVPGAATFEDGLACMRVLEAARASARAGGAEVPCR